MSRRNIVYISGAITQNPNYILDFTRAESKLKEAIKYGEYDFTSICNPALVNANLPKDFTHKDYMRVCFAMMDSCDSIYMLTGWESSKGNLADVAPGMSIGGNRFGNYEKKLPSGQGRTYYECDINYVSGRRGAERIVFSNDGLVFYTNDHYESFEQLY
jgi:hypothetical protein